ncbi:MAG: CaiB/BaiF CoA transferase family protein [Acidimicrobiales bacterium]
MVAGVLDGVRVVELASYVAAPTAGRLLAAFGAEVIKIERPGVGDELRRWHTFGSETSLLWRSLGRNKKSVTVDLRQPEGRDLVLHLVARSDVVVEGFRPGTLERLGLGPDVLAGVRPDLILVRISGFGQTGPYRDQAGFGSVAEAMGGVRFLTGYPDRPPTRAGVSLGDSVAGLYAAFGAVLGLLERRSAATEPAGAGASPGAVGTSGTPSAASSLAGAEPAEVVDVALYEAVYSLLDSVVAEYDTFGVVRQRTGPSIAGVVPSSTYRCADGKYVVIAANADAVFERFVRAIGRPEMAGDPRYQGPEARGKAEEEIDGIVAAWVAERDLAEVVAAMTGAGVPATPIYDAADIAADPHFAARGTHDRHDIPLGDRVAAGVPFPAPVPRLSRRPAQARWAGPDLGEHTREVLGGLLGVPDDRLDDLAARKVI